ncbi:MAG: penicillin-binding protein 2 [Verrucomicrobia bacterium]|nr:penicillin-binding protein 2 [Verrucomicrobiota bacterium]
MSKGFASNYRIVLLAVGIFGCFAGLGTRLVFVHVIEREKYLDGLERARRQIIVEKARRGDIVDSRGNILATSRSLIVLGVDPQSLVAKDEKKWPQLAELIGVPLADLTRIFNTKTRSAAAVAAAPAAKAAGALSINFPNLSPAAATTPEAADAAAVKTDDADETEFDETPNEKGDRLIRWAKLSESVEESTYAKIQALGIKGVYGSRVYRRAYPHNSLAAHVIGYVNKQGEPAAGIERYADFYLHGRDGWREGERDGLRRELAQFRTRDVAPADGYSVMLSLDSTVQHIAEEEMDYIAKRFQPEKATIIISDPRTGFILALANYPTFNLNEYNKVPKSDEGVMRNIAVADMYEPGSVFKIVAASGALNEGLVTPQTTFDCSLTKIDYRGKPRSLAPEDHHFENPRAVPLTQVLSYSSNRGAAQLAMLMGEEKFYDYARAFGFGQNTGFPVGGETPGMMAPPKKWDGLTITRMPMGHAIAATPMQMQMAMGVIASGGILQRPQIIQQIRDASGEVVYRYTGMNKHRVISEQTARTMAVLLEGVASDHGTAPEAAIPNYEVAGKTGTTQKVINGRYSEKHHVASFIGFFPASRPQVVVSVIVDGADEHAPGGVAYGKTVAAPSFKRIGERLIPYLDIKPVQASPAGPALLAMGVTRR